MSENVLKTIQSILQDIIAPDIREIKARQAAMQEQIDLRFKEVETRFNAVDKQIELQVGGLKQQFETHVHGMDTQMGYLEKHLLSAFATSQMQTELTGAKAVVDLRERIAVLETQRA